MENPCTQSVDKVDALTDTEKLAKQGSKLENKGAYMDVSDRRLQARLTMQAKIPTILISFVGIFAFAGFVSGLKGLSH